MTSQYDPAGREVVKVALQAESALLIATKPRDPAGNQRNEYIIKIKQTSSKGNLLWLRGNPVGQRRRAYVIAEPDHTANGEVSVLAEPASSSAIDSTSARA